LRYGFQGGLGCFGHATCDHFPSIEGRSIRSPCRTAAQEKAGAAAG
jgi:hypothetical protein